MATLVPFFITGANAKIKVNTLTLAFATDIQYSIRVRHAAPHVLGVFEAFSQEPLAYDVVGSFSIIRYTRGLKNYVDGVNGQTALGQFLGQESTQGAFQNALFGGGQGTSMGNTPADVSNKGDGVGAWGPANGLETVLGSVAGNTFGGGSRADQSFDPSKLHVPLMFDIEVWQKAVGNESGCIARLRGCRLTGSDFKLNRKGVATQSFTFQACYADEDSFNAGVSGVGQTVM